MALSLHSPDSGVVHMQTFDGYTRNLLHKLDAPCGYTWKWMDADTAYGGSA